MSASTLRVPCTTRRQERAGHPPAPAVGPFAPASSGPAALGHLVHKASVGQVMLTGWRRVDATHFQVTAAWPAGHTFYASLPGGYHDPLIAAETIRQVGSLLGHAAFGIPAGHQFLMHGLDITVDPRHLRARDTSCVLDIDVSCVDITQRGGALTRMRYETVLRHEGHVIATGGAHFSCLSPAVYRRLRGPRPLSSQQPPPLPLTAPAAPQSVGRTSPSDVVLSPTGEKNRWQLRADTRHPVLFDHPLDHVPGMLLLEAARQATTAALGRACLPLRIAVEFQRYTELDAPCEIEADRADAAAPGGAEQVTVSGRQNDAEVFTCTVNTAPAL